MTDKEYILQQLSKLNDEQAYFAKLFMQAMRGKAPDTRDARIAAAVPYQIKEMKVWQNTDKLRYSERQVYRLLAAFKQRTRQCGGSP